MKKLHRFFPLVFSTLLFAITSAHAAVLTNDTAIGALDTNYEGADVVISNCTVTVDGAHSFASLQVAPGGVLTHSFFPNGTSSTFFIVTDEEQILSSTNPATLLHTNVSLPVTVMDLSQTITYTNDVDYVTVTQPDGTTQLQWTNTSAIADGATVLVSYSWLYTVKSGLTLTVTNDVTIASGGSINANGNGYGGALGNGRGFTATGSFADGSGAGHGGNGGGSASNAIGGVCYGSVAQPVNLGSGGGSSYAGSGGNGGGLVQIAAGGNINIHGLISVNGADATNSRAGGGAGGSVWLIATNVSGTGSITANGGAGEPVRGGGGGGGRIAIQCDTNNFSGSLAAIGGMGGKAGGAGTIFTQVTGQNGFLLVDNGGRAGTNSTIALPTQTDVLIRSNASVNASGTWIAGNVTIAPGGKLVALYQAQMNLTVTGTLAVQSGGAITADVMGYTAGNGSGAGQFYVGGNYPCSGAGHGGTGARGYPTNAIAGMTYGSQTTPTTLGSGGGTYSSFSMGGNGGGALNISVAGTLQVDGTISANGGNGSGTGGGGGSGGSVSITATTITGSGAILANGGNGAGTIGGGGGGGRIALNSNSNGFSGTVIAAGGGGANWGGAGTIYIHQTVGNIYQLILDNAGHAGTNTPVQSQTTGSLIIRNGAVGTASLNATFASLDIASNAWLISLGPNSYFGLSVTVSGDVTIQAGGGIIADLAGYTPGTSGGSYPGASTSFPYGCGGGGHGGAGGNAVENSAPGGKTSESSVTSPYYAGSGGGNYAPYSLGGNGGGVIYLNVTGKLRMDGTISANGGNASGLGGGGGAGGSINLSAGTIAGGGAILANGGNGVDAIGGGGGGGCIAVAFTSNLFSGTLTAYGGAGANYGGAGTIYLKTNTTSRSTLIVDNGGHVGANTMTYFSSTTDLNLRNGGFVFLNNSAPAGNLLVSSNGWLVISNVFTPNLPATLNLTSSGNVTVEPGGVISADFTGYRTGQGTGAGTYYSSSPNYPGGGGGHAGYGAHSVSNYAGGGTAGFDTLTAPTIAGSGGGGVNSSVGGNGGGVIQMTISGNLQVDGTLSANGGNGSGNGGGGGAGGSLNLSVGKLLGAGVISANGGNGVASVGGGGGGGIIACVLTSNLFSGTISASGGGGANYAGAGVIYIRTNTAAGNLSAFIVDNAGHRGTNTPVSSLSSSSSLIIRNGASVIQSFPPQTVSSLLITSNAWLVGNNAPGNNYPGIVNIIVNGSATIQAGGGIFSDASGSAQNSGNGHGNFSTLSPWYPCSGAGHGGYGANSATNSSGAAIGGGTYDSAIAPTVNGGGGGGYSTFSFGGAGGGYVNLTVNGALQLDGLISANGGDGAGSGGGGGAGGGIKLNLGTFAGAGNLAANGGNGVLNFGGGGGGGRIAVLFNTNLFAGTANAFGGGGARYGGAGTVYYKTNSQPYGQLVLDNASHAGTNTTFDSVSLDVTVQNKAVGMLPSLGLWTARNILIRTNGVLTGTPSTGARTVVANSLTIDAGGALTLDSAGNIPFNSGSSIRGGGGHGGYGGGNSTIYGLVYDSIQSPSVPGNGGGSYQAPPYYQGGYGGGALNLIIPGTVTVNGRLSANGGNGDFNAGGGAGGSLNLQNILTLAGSGVISANGGATTGAAGGGGGGRIAILCTTNDFTGQFSATGGNAPSPGGAGTIYTRVGSNTRTLLVDNGGVTGTNTPLSSSYALPTFPFDLNISGAASVVPLTPLPLLSNLTISAGSVLTMIGAQSNLTVAVLKDFNLAGTLNVDNQGYAQAAGPGTGGTISNKGSGGGYGGLGGNSSSGAVGGASYGSATQPVDFGSGGGGGLNTLSGGSQGGGALRVSVSGTFTLDGTVSANGNSGWQEDSGGGAGGSVWLSANTLAGLGTISAAGGDGELLGGGGGGGGRIAIYSPTNLFAGSTNANGGNGASPGQPGSIFLSAILPDFQIISQSPTGIVANTVSSVDLTFNEAIDTASASSANFTLITPGGPMAPENMSATAIGIATMRVSFPVQNLLGDYSIQVATTIKNIYGQPLAQTYTNGFTITIPTISGTVADTNGAPVAGVLLQPDGGLPGVVTDGAGNYSIGVPPGWNGSVTPSLGSFVFVPGSLSYTDLPGSATNQNYLMVTTIVPDLAAGLSETNLSISWTGIPGVTYQTWWSTNLVDWSPLGSALAGTNGPMQILLPLDTDPAAFFRLGATP